MAQRGTAVGISLVFLALVGCGGAAGGGRRAREDGAPRARARLLLEWRSENPAVGDERLQVLSNGHARYAFVPPYRFRDQIRARAALQPERFRRMRAELTRLQACALRSAHDESAPVPRATLELDLPQMRCTIRLTDREWRLDDRARDVVAAIDEMKRWMQQ